MRLVVVAKSCPILCDSRDCSTPGFSVLQYLPEFAWIYAHWVGNAIQPFHPLLPLSPFAFSLSQHQSPVSWLFTSYGQSFGASASASALPVNIQGWFPLGLTDLISLQSERPSRVFLRTTIQEHQFFGAQPFLWSYSQSIHDYWKNRCFDYRDLCWQSDVSAFLICCLGWS